MDAGKSAADQAARARRAAAALERKAKYASWLASNYERGAAGEARVGEALAPLEAEGWCVLHDLIDPEGGNIDHLVVGPPGIAVIDAKNWSNPITITADRRLVIGKDDHTSQLRRLEQRVRLVERLVGEEGQLASVRGYFVLCGESDRERRSADLGDLRVLGLDHLVQRLSKSPPNLEPENVELVAEAIEQRLAPTPPEEIRPPSALFEKAHRIYYLRPWKKAGHNRLYLRDSSGSTLGWTDVNTGAMQIDCSGEDAKFAEVLLAAADPTGVKLAPGDLPKVATRVWGGRLLSKIARLHTTVLIGQEWRRYDKHRLYGTLIDPRVTTFDLGHIDLKTNSFHPSIDGPVATDRATAQRYLEILRLRFPETPPTPSQRA